MNPSFDEVMVDGEPTPFVARSALEGAKAELTRSPRVSTIHGEASAVSASREKYSACSPPSKRKVVGSGPAGNANHGSDETGLRADADALEGDRSSGPMGPRRTDGSGARVSGVSL